MNVAIIVAAGSGERFGSEDKQFALLAGVPVLSYSIAAFASAKRVDSIVLVTRADAMERCRTEIINAAGLGDRAVLVPGGRTRQESVLIGLKSCPVETEIVWVHDGARPLVRSEQIDSSAVGLRGLDGLVFAEPIMDTVKEVHDGVITLTRPREYLWRAQTPQLFSHRLLLDAHVSAANEGFEGTDDAVLVERVGGRVGIFPGSAPNIKITTEDDLRAAELELARRIE